MIKIFLDHKMNLVINNPILDFFNVYKIINGWTKSDNLNTQYNGLEFKSRQVDSRSDTFRVVAKTKKPCWVKGKVKFTGKPGQRQTHIKLVSYQLRQQKINLPAEKLCIINCR